MEYDLIVKRLSWYESVDSTRNNAHILIVEMKFNGSGRLRIEWIGTF